MSSNNSKILDFDRLIVEIFQENNEVDGRAIRLTVQGQKPTNLSLDLMQSDRAAIYPADLEEFETDLQSLKNAGCKGYVLDINGLKEQF